MALLAEAPTLPHDQLTLPFMNDDDDDEPGTELGAVGLRDAEEEIRWLDHLLALAREASLKESKLCALQRFLARANQPALVFTEYRDTLRHLATALASFDPLELHGGLTRQDRRRTLQQFAESESRLLLATDAASEGLNLHHRCRLVVSLELPWTPLRLEQRIGRVDRLGQRRRVHAVQFIAAGGSEDAGLARFAGRNERIRATLDATRAAHEPCVSSLRHEAEAEATRLQVARALSTHCDVSPPSRPVVTCITRRGVPRGRTWAVRLPIVDAEGLLVFETIAGLHDARDTDTLDDLLDQVAAASHRHGLATLSTTLHPSILLLTRRENAIIDALRQQHARLSLSLLQPGLFDRRAERAAAAQAAIVDAAVRASLARLQALGRLRDLHEGAREIAFGIDFPLMLTGVGGGLITSSFAQTELSSLEGVCPPPDRVVREIEAWSAHREVSFGPASGVRAITDGIVIPLLRILGFAVAHRINGQDDAQLNTSWRGVLLVSRRSIAGWDQSLDAAWRTSILGAIRSDARWCFCCNGTRLRIIDGHRAWSRHYLEFDLALLWQRGGYDDAPVEPLPGGVTGGNDAPARSAPSTCRRDTEPPYAARSRAGYSKRLNSSLGRSPRGLDVMRRPLCCLSSRSRCCIAFSFSSLPKLAVLSPSGTRCIAIATQSIPSSPHCWRDAGIAASGRQSPRFRVSPMQDARRAS